MNAIPASPEREWLETDGLGGFASGTAELVRTRRYHALLLSATKPPADRFVLVNGIEAWVETPAGRFAISSQVFGGDVVSPDGADRIERFEPDPWPRWTFRIEDGTAVEQEIFVSRGSGATVLLWRLGERSAPVWLSVRPLLSGRDYHALHHENPSFRFEPETIGDTRVWRPHDGVPAIAATSNGEYVHEPFWYRNFLYREERARGLDSSEDLASPGLFRFNLSAREAVLIFESGQRARSAAAGKSPVARAASLQMAEDRRRRGFPSRLHRAAEDYVVRRGDGKTIVAGYPWFADWGRDTFIALRGLCLATGRFREAREILLGWAVTISEGMLPNRFPDRGGVPEFNSVDASLWYVVAVRDLLVASTQRRSRVSAADRGRLLESVEQILEAYARGTRYGIRADGDGLLAAGVPGTQLTWMDAKVGDRVITPRIGKPVEVQALWINALRIGALASARWTELADCAADSFASRFWNEDGGWLYDVVDCDHRAGTADASFRPNQIFAVGGLPFSLLSGDRARRVVDAVESRLLTPAGLRSLAPDDPAYLGHYSGGIEERDGAYHQGTVWPWLLGPFVEAWVRVRGGTSRAKGEARARFLGPLLEHSNEAGLGHIPEIAEGDPPHRPCGCPFQAWSVGEALRLDLKVLAEGVPGQPRTRD